MANTQGICNSFKSELMLGYHCLGTGIRSADTVKAALYLTTATINYDTTAYTATGEVSGTNYTATGTAVTNATAPTNTTGASGVAYWTPSAAITWSTVTLSTAFDCVLLYNSTQTNRAIGAFTFGAQTVTAGNLTINMPTNNSTTGLVRIA
jgi:hypothetical protein